MRDLDARGHNDNAVAESPQGLWEQSGGCSPAEGSDRLDMR